MITRSKIKAELYWHCQPKERHLIVVILLWAVGRYWLLAVIAAIRGNEKRKKKKEIREKKVITRNVFHLHRLVLKAHDQNQAGRRRRRSNGMMTMMRTGFSVLAAHL